MKQNTRLHRSLFVSCGLSDKESVLYDLLLSSGESTGYELEQTSGFKKNTYTLLKNLARKNLVMPIKKDNKQYFQAAPPQNLLHLVEKQEELISQTKGSLEQIMPDLSGEYALHVGKPTIQYFEGEEGLRKVFADIYAPKKDIVYGCVDLEKADSVFPKHILADLIPLRVQNKLLAYSLVADSDQARILKYNDAKQLRKTLLFNKTKYPLPSEIDVYEDKIAMLSFEKGKFIGIIIQNNAFAQSLKSIFKRVFDPEPHQ